jgi:hypothetical protein
MKPFKPERGDNGQWTVRVSYYPHERTTEEYIFDNELEATAFYKRVLRK